MGNELFDFLEEVGFDKNQTRIEKYRLDGTSNYLISLNHCGVTWAVAIRLPAMGSEYSKFQKEKVRAVSTAEFLVEHFGKGVELSENVRFVFAGDSQLVSYDSVMEFFSFQNALPPLIEQESVTVDAHNKVVDSLSYPRGIDSLRSLDDTKKEQVKQYLSSYQGSFFVSKGAPASETLDDYWHMVPEVTRALSVLHTHSGRTSVFPADAVVTLAKQFDEALQQLACTSDFSVGSSVHESFEKHQRKRNPNNDSSLTACIKKELLLRTAAGKQLLSELITTFTDTRDVSEYSCFTHNDPHCENFIIVKYLYELVQKNHPYIDREFANKIIEDAGVSQKISVVYDEHKNALLYRLFEKADSTNNAVNVLRPSTRYDIHLIDIDDATGITPNEQRVYLYDLLLFAQSVQNLSSIKGEKILVEDTIRAYYDCVE